MNTHTHTHRSALNGEKNIFKKKAIIIFVLKFEK